MHTVSYSTVDLVDFVVVELTGLLGLVAGVVAAAAAGRETLSAAVVSAVSSASSSNAVVLNSSFKVEFSKLEQFRGGFVNVTAFMFVNKEIVCIIHIRK